MTEKVIHEVRFIETDDGFRIEVKGDKERMRDMGCGHGMMGFGPMRFMHRRRHGRHGRRHRHGHGFGPWGWWWDDVEDDEDDTYKKPPKEA